MNKSTINLDEADTNWLDHPLHIYTKRDILEAALPILQEILSEKYKSVPIDYSGYKFYGADELLNHVEQLLKTNGKK